MVFMQLFLPRLETMKRQQFCRQAHAYLCRFSPFATHTIILSVTSFASVSAAAAVNRTVFNEETSINMNLSLSSNRNRWLAWL